MAFLSNWASFFSELEFADGACKQVLHVPYMDSGVVPTDICLIFKPTKDTYGMFVITRKISDEALAGKGGAEESLLGEEILPK